MSSRGGPRAETLASRGIYRVAIQQRTAARRAVEWIGASKARLIVRYEISDLFLTVTVSTTFEGGGEIVKHTKIAKPKLARLLRCKTVHHYGMVYVKSQCYTGWIRKILSSIKISQQDAPARRPKN